jgi:hypothetical protein
MTDMTTDESRPRGGPGLAIASLVCGILGLFTAGLAGIAGLICGIISLVKGNAGKGMAIAGVILSGLSVLILPMAIIAAIAIPNLLESRVTANEAAAASTLKSGFMPAQVMFQAQAESDVDGDGVGEYGTFDELLAKGLVGPHLRGGRANGYRYAIYLPDGPEGAITDASARTAANADGQERRYVIYAWPESFGDTGRRTFAITQEGMIYAKPTETGSDADAVPAWNAAFAPGSTWDKPQMAWRPYSR